MREFSGEITGADRIFNPVRNVAIANEADAREIARSAIFGEIVGLALRAVANCPRN